MRRLNGIPRSQPKGRGARSAARAVIPADIRQLLGAPPLTGLENATDYDRLMQMLAAAIDPRDGIEWIYLRNIVDLEWEARRARQAKRTTLALNRERAIASILGPVEIDLKTLSNEELEELQRMLDGPGANECFIAARQNRLANTLANAGLDESAIEGEAFRLCLPDLERLERLITLAETRRDLIIRDLYRRRQALADEPRRPYRPARGGAR